MAESFVSTLKAELVSGLEFPSRQAAKTAIFDYLETFYNTRRLRSALLGYKSPAADFEEDRIEEVASRKVNVSVLPGESHQGLAGAQEPVGKSYEEGAATRTHLDGGQRKRAEAAFHYKSRFNQDYKGLRAQQRHRRVQASEQNST